MKMKTVLLLSIVMLLAGLQVAVADVPSTMNYQGRLTKQDGAALPDGNYDITFYLYDAATAGTYLWSESHQVSTKVRLFQCGPGQQNDLGRGGYQYVSLLAKSRYRQRNDPAPASWPQCPLRLLPAMPSR